jgi:hypothetical protein
MKETPPVTPVAVLPTEVVSHTPAESAQKEENVVKAGTIYGALLPLTEWSVKAALMDALPGMAAAVNGVTVATNPWTLALIPAGAALGWGTAKLAEKIGRSTMETVEITEEVPAEIVHPDGRIEPAVAQKVTRHENVPQIERPDLVISTRLKNWWNQVTDKPVMPIRVTPTPATI